MIVLLLLLLFLATKVLHSLISTVLLTVLENHLNLIKRPLSKTVQSACSSCGRSLSQSSSSRAGFVTMRLGNGIKRLNKPHVYFRLIWGHVSEVPWAFPGQMLFVPLSRRHHVRHIEKGQNSVTTQSVFTERRGPFRSSSFITSHIFI